MLYNPLRPLLHSCLGLGRGITLGACLEGLILVVNLWTKGVGVNPSTLPLAASPAQRRSSATKQIMPEFFLALGLGC